MTLLTISMKQKKGKHLKVLDAKIWYTQMPSKIIVVETPGLNNNMFYEYWKESMDKKRKYEVWDKKMIISLLGSEG